MGNESKFILCTRTILMQSIVAQFSRKGKRVLIVKSHILMYNRNIEQL